MKLLASLALIALLIVLAQQTEASVGGCAGGTLAVTVIEQIATANHFSIKDSSAYWCKALGGSQDWLVNICSTALGAMASVIQTDFDAGLTPDETARKLQLCKDDELTCSLWPKGSTFTEQAQIVHSQEVSAAANAAFMQFVEETEAIMEYVFGAMFNWSTIDGIKAFSDFPALSKHQPQMQSTGDDPWYLRPWVDEDKDLFSSFDQLRGANWRGKDCDEKNAEIYPTRSARSSKTSSPWVDHNCNGILGATSKGEDYEKLWCSSKTYQYVGLGDSATAHFSLPPAWLSGANIKPGTYASLLPIAMNEVDFPQCSLTTGYNSTLCPSLSTSLTPFNSIYNFGRSRNLCSHRQYQNLGINGASYKNYAPKLKASFKPNPATDLPAIVVLNLIGNDVCGKHTDPKDMTSPTEYKDGLMEIIAYLDSVLTPGSHVFISGLVDGTLLYDTMWNRVHPTGTTYKAFYDFLNCLNTSPCSGWMNSNPAIRAATTAHARELAQIARDVIDKQSTLGLKSITLHYTDVEKQLADIVAEFKRVGKDASRLIEATDGFHPSSTTNSLLATAFQQQLDKQGLLNEVFPVNPFNDKIAAAFTPMLNGY